MNSYLFMLGVAAYLPLFGQTATPTPPMSLPATKVKPAIAAEAATASEASKPSSAVMMIDPKARASDLMKAFDLLRKEKTSPKVFFELRSGKVISNVIDMTLMPEGTLIVFRYTTPQGVLLEIAGVDEIVGLYHQ